MLGRFLVLLLEEVGTYPMSSRGPHVDRTHAAACPGQPVMVRGIHSEMHSVSCLVTNPRQYTTKVPGRKVGTYGYSP